MLNLKLIISLLLVNFYIFSQGVPGSGDSIAYYNGKQVHYGNNYKYPWTIDVYITAGQSNARGSAAFAAPESAGLLGRHEEASLFAYDWRYFDVYESGRTHFRNSADLIGYGYEFPMYTNWDSNNRLYVIKHAISGTRLAEDTGDDWNVNSTGEYYDQLKSMISEALRILSNESYTYNLKGVIWFQGEADCTESYSAVYQQNQLDLIDSLRAFIGISDLPFYLCRINYSTAYTETINNTKIYAAANRTNVIYIDTSNLEFSDGTHMTTAGTITLSDTLINNINRLNY